MKNTGKLWQRCLLQGLICFAVFMTLHFAGFFSSFENKTYDQRMKWVAKDSPASDEIAFIEINQASLDWALKNKGWSWPWPREAYGQIIEFLSAGNVKSIAFDILYTERSVYGEKDDELLGQAEKASGKVIQTINITEVGWDTEAFFPVAPIKDNAALIGNVTSIKDSDDIIRRSRFGYEWEGQFYPNLGFAPLFLTGELDSQPEGFPFLKDGSIYLNFRESLDSYFPYQACDILESYDAWKNQEEGILSPSDFNDLYVFFALYAPGLYDICSTPVSQVYPGVGIHITALDNYLTNSFIKKMPVPVEILWFLTATFFGAIIICVSLNSKSQRLSIMYIVLGFLIGIFIFVLIPYFAFVNYIWISMVAPLILFVMSFIISLIIGFNQEGKQKRFIKSAFSQCLAKDVVNQILEDPDSFTLGGKKFQMSAIFTDIQKFSSFSELLSASELGAVLNYYLTKMSDIIIEEKGTVDKYEGDAIVALVGAPVEMKNHAYHACKAAIKMKKEEILMNQDIYRIANEENSAALDQDLYNAFCVLKNNNKKIFTRIGINSGEMIAGYFGSEKKKNYTMMGHNVNLASRLEGVNKQYSTGILISGETRDELGEDFVVRTLDKVQVVNVEKAVQLFELVEEKSVASETLKKNIALWEIAMEQFVQKNYDKALELFEQYNKENASDQTCVYYINLLKTFFLKGTYPTSKDGVGVEYIPDLNVFKLLQK